MAMADVQINMEHTLYEQMAALCASLGAAVIGTLGAYGFTKVL